MGLAEVHQASSRQVNTWYLTIGGEVREEWERIGNDNWGQQPLMNGYLLQRYMLHVDTRYGRYFRTFVQLKSGLELFRAGGPGRLTRRSWTSWLPFWSLALQEIKIGGNSGLAGRN